MGEVLILPIIRKVRLCADCEEPISDARLRVQPQARRCVECETDRAKRHQTVLGFSGQNDIVIIKG